MKVIGYARVSSTGQGLELQQEQLRAAGCDKLFCETKSGSRLEGRNALEEALDYAREGDTFIVTRLDRLARSASDLHSIVNRLTQKGVVFKCLQQGAVDTSTSTGKLVLAMLAAIAEFELDIRRERQREGIEKAKAKGVYKGRPSTIEAAKVQELRASGLGASEIARRLKIGRASVYRLLKEAA